MTRLRSGSATDRGRVRPVNQDRVVVAPDLVAVADGMGGHVGGEVAARTAVDTLINSFGDERTSDGLVTAVQAANRAIWEQSRLQGELRGMGTTLTAAALVDDSGEQHLTLVNVGDSRAYLYTAGDLVQLTQDHSLVEEMVRHGEITAAEAASHPHRHILTRALGIDRGVEIDAWQLAPPEGSRVLLCSDGLTNELSEDEIAGVLSTVADPDGAAAELVRIALDHGGNDNISAVVVDVVGDNETVAPPAAGVDRPPPSPRKPGTAGHTEGLTGVVPAIPLSIAPSSRGARGAAGAAAAGAAAEGAAAAAGAADGAASSGGGTSVVPAVPAGEPPRTDATGLVPSTEPRPGGSPRGEILVNRALGGNGAAAGGAEEDARSSRPVLLVAPTRRKGASRERLLTLRVVFFTLAFVATLGGAAGVVGWFVEASYFVGLRSGHVAIYHGRPGGLLWFHPSVVEVTGLTTKDLIPPDVPPLRAGVEEPSLDAAKAYVKALADKRSIVPLYSGTTTLPASTIPTGPGLSTTTTAPQPAATSTTAPAATSTTPTSTSPPTSTAPPTTSTTTTTTTPKTTTTKPPGTGAPAGTGG